MNARPYRKPRKLVGHSCRAMVLLLLAPALLHATELDRETLQAWNAYVRAAEMRMEERAKGQAPFLWVDEEQGPAQRVRAGEVVIVPAEGASPHAVPKGLIHDWLGAVFVPKATLDDVMGVLNDYGRYKDIYQPMVANARLLDLQGNREKVALLMVQKAYHVVGAVQTVNEIRIASLGPARLYTVSTSLQVLEIAGYGTPNQHALPEDQGPGYVWRTFTLTRLEARDGGVYAEVEMIELSRGIPAAFRWLLKPLAERLPRHVLLATLEETRDAVKQETNLK